MWYYLQKKRHGRVIVNEKLIMNGLRVKVLCLVMCFALRLL